MAKGGATSERILDAAMQLFAARGYAGTSVDDIIEAAGLTRRSGALYKHFASKRALLEAVVDRHAEALDSVAELTALMPLGDVRAELTLLAKWSLRELSAEDPLLAIIQRDGDAVPGTVESYRDQVVQRGYREMGRLLGKRLGLPADGPLDLTALAAVFLGALVNYRQAQRTFGQPPGEVDEDTLVETWVELLANLARSAAGDEGVRA